MAGKGGGGGRTITGVTVPIGADITGLGKGLVNAANGVDKFYAGVSKAIANSPFGKAGKQVTDLGKGFAILGKSAVAPLKPLADGLANVAKQAKAGVADVAKLAAGVSAMAAAGVAATAAFASGGLKRIGELGEQSLSLGIASDKLSELQFAARATGASAEDLNGFLKGLTGTIHASIGVISPASEAFKKLGTSAEQLTLLSPDKQFAAIKAGFDALPDAASKADAAVKIGGEAGLKLFKLLGMGAKEFEALKAKSASTGFTVKPEDLAKVQAANAAFGQIGMVIDGVINQLTVALAPAITYVSDAFTTFFADAMKDSKFFDGMIEGFVGGFARLADTAVGISLVFRDVFAGIGQAIGQAIGWIGKLLDAVATVIPSMKGIADGVKGIAKTVADFGDRQADSAKKARAAFDASKPSDAITKAFEDFKKATEGSAKATAANTAATQRAATANNPLLESIGKLKTEFATAISDAGLTAEMKQIEALKRQGASTKDLIELTRQANAVREAGKRDSLAEDLRESTKLPVEKLAEDLGRINRLLAEGKITQKQAILGAAQKTKDSGIAGGETKFAGALQANSTEGRSYLLSQTVGKAQDALSVARQGVEATLQGNGLLGQMLGALNRPDVQAAF
jgi:hypothetical protein